MWDALLLQEVSPTFTAEEHIQVLGTPTTGGRSTSTTLHRRHASGVVKWSGGAFPTLSIKTDDSARQLTFVNVYLPHVGHPDDVWHESLHTLCAVLRNKSGLGYICAAGDCNSHSLRHLLKPEGDSREDTWSKQVCLHTDLQRAEALHELLEQTGLVALAPPGGLATTFRPYHGGAEKVLDYIFVSRGMSSAPWVCNSLEVALATDHKPLTALLRRAPLQGTGRRRSRYIRRKWKDWSEASPGQFAALLTHGGLATIEQAEQNIARAGASSARRAAQGS